MERGKNWGVLLYVLAAVAAVVLPAILTTLPRGPADLFPEPRYDEVVRLIGAPYRP
jgi:hypothetical protein